MIRTTTCPSYIWNVPPRRTILAMTLTLIGLVGLCAEIHGQEIAAPTGELKNPIALDQEHTPAQLDRHGITGSATELSKPLRPGGRPDPIPLDQLGGPLPAIEPIIPMVREAETPSPAIEEQHTAQQHSARQYKVRFSVPHRVGEKWQVRQQIVQVRQMTARRGDEVADQRTEDSRIEFSAEVEVLAVDEQGNETQLLVTAQKAILRAGTDIQEIVKPGTQIIAEMGQGKTLFRAKDQDSQLPGLAVRLLPRLIKMTDDPVTLDDLFGAETPRTVGVGWTADDALLLKMVRALDPTIQEKDVSSLAELVDVTQVNGKEHLDVSFSIATRSATPPAPPADMTPLGTTLAISGTARFPADYSTEDVAHSLQVRTVGRFAGKPGTDKEGYTFEISSAESDTATIEYAQWTAVAAEPLPVAQSSLATVPTVATRPPVGTPVMAPIATPVAALVIGEAPGEPEVVLRQFLLAMLTRDRDAIKRLSLPHADASILWQGTPPPPQMLGQLKNQCEATPLRRLNVGETIALPGGRVFTVDATLVNQDRQLLAFPSGPLPLPLVRRQGEWRVDASPIIRARQAAARSAVGQNGS